MRNDGVGVMGNSVRSSFSARADVIAKRTYCRPLGGGHYESWEQVVDRVIGHQRWLWEVARGEKALGNRELEELEEVRALLLDRKASVAGRTLWLGGTNIAKSVQASQFNCSGLVVETVHDVVDAFWLLLQGCGVGFEPRAGSLNGFTRKMEIEVVRSQRHLLMEKKGREENRETIEKREGKVVWTLSVGDSAKAWAKAVGKLLAGKKQADVLVLDFSQIRPAGERLAGYGWFCSGDETISVGFKKIAEVLNGRAGELLTRIDILDILNHLGTTLSSRRSAEIALVPYGDAEWVEFAQAKKEFWLKGNEHRQQSNNSLVFWQKPSAQQLYDVLMMMQEAGGSEPGFVNAVEAKRRGKWFSTFNPCCEIILGNKSFCNLVEINLERFNGKFEELKRALWVMGRANYRQTCVNLVDGVLQRAWHENNEFLRLCGVGLTGIVCWEFCKEGEKFEALREAARAGAFSMADELEMPRPKAVTTVKPSGTLSKIMDTTEGVHKPLGRYIFNNVRFSKHDPYVKALKRARYRVIDDPTSSDAVLVTFPVKYDGVEFDQVDGKEVNIESAVSQLERYKMMMEHYVDHNCSITVSYSPEEVDSIVNWLLDNWNTYVGVSFLYRNDPTKTAKDLGYLYLPQEVVTKEVYEEYVGRLREVKEEEKGSEEMGEEVDDYEVDAGTECLNGVCPIR